MQLSLTRKYALLLPSAYSSQMKGKTMFFLSTSSPGYSLGLRSTCSSSSRGAQLTPPQLPPPLRRCYCSYYLHTDLLQELRLKLSVQMNQNHKDLLPNAMLAYAGLMGERVRTQAAVPADRKDPALLLGVLMGTTSP